MLKPPRVDDTIGSPNAVRPSKISENIMVIHIKHQFISLFMVFKFLNLVIRRNIYMVTFREFAYREITLLV